MANIVFRPTCSRCLEILDDQIIDYHETLIPGNEKMLPHKSVSIEPQRCPYCGEVFKTIVMPRAGAFPINDKSLMEDSDNIDRRSMNP